MSLGMSRLRIIRHIVLAPALRAIYPALASQFVLQLLGSSLVSAIAAEELTAVGNNIMMQDFPELRGVHHNRDNLFRARAGVPGAVRFRRPPAVPLVGLTDDPA